MTRLLLAIVVAMSALAGGALAQSFPARPITLINPYAAGGPADLLARAVAEGMSERSAARSSSTTAGARAPPSGPARWRRPSPTATRFSSAARRRT